jgi:rod shape-determining protein MreC
MKLIKDRKKYKIFLAVVLLLIFLNIIGFSAWGQRILVNIINPISKSTREISSDLGGGRESRSDLLNKFTSLEEGLQKNEVDMAKLYSLEEENERLREYLSFFNESKLGYVLANVVWQENFLNLSHYNQNIVIDRGSQDGLREGLAVINHTGVIVGKIIEVNSKTSRVCLINNNFCRLAVSLSNSSRSIGLAEGDLGLSIKVNFVSQNESVSEGDRIITSGLEADIPKGLAVGKVNYVNQEVNDIWQDINAEALFDIDSLNIVSVIIPDNFNNLD